MYYYSSTNYVSNSGESCSQLCFMLIRFPCLRLWALRNYKRWFSKVVIVPHICSNEWNLSEYSTVASSDAATKLYLEVVNSNPVPFKSINIILLVILLGFICSFKFTEWLLPNFTLAREAHLVFWWNIGLRSPPVGWWSMLSKLPILLSAFQFTYMI